MLGPRRFVELACLALIVLLVEDVVVVLIVFINIALLVLFGHLAGTDSAGFVVGPEADKGQDIGGDNFVVGDFLVGHVLENAIYFIEGKST